LNAIRLKIIFNALSNFLLIFYNQNFHSAIYESILKKI
jgi:hypothetical protein